MVRSAAQPFDFDEFGADAVAPEPVFTVAELEAARREGHEAALGTIIADQARTQTALLENISITLTTAQREFDSTLAARKADLTETARNIVMTFCAGAAADRQIDIALDLLEKYLAATPDQTPVTLLLPQKTTEVSVTSLRDYFIDRGIAEFASVETSDEIPTGDCRIKWRGGAMKRDMNTITEEIRSIFASVDSNAVANCGQKARNS